MLHLLLDDRPWFRPKRRGYGTGMPLAWQGWAMLALHIALIAGVGSVIFQFCHPRESGDPVLRNPPWVPAFAGMTK